jgi:hypothetical protein
VTDAPPSDAPAESSAGASWLATMATSTDGVYGLIIVAGMIVVSRDLTASSGDALISVVTTLLVFFAAHVYAAAVSQLARRSGGDRGLGAAVRHGIRESSGMIVAGIVPVAILGLGVIGVLADADAVWLALGVDVTLLGILGWLIAASRTDRVLVRLASLLVTAAFGGVIIALKALIHH